MGKASKEKGNTGERQLCKVLSATFGGSFIRVPNSGAFTGGKNATRKDDLSAGQVRASKGDIVPPDHMPGLVLECKFYATFPWHQLLDRCALLDGWLKQAREAGDPGDLSLVAWKINRQGWYVAVPDSPTWAVGTYTRYQAPTGPVIITRLEPFLTLHKEELLRCCA